MYKIIGRRTDIRYAYDLVARTTLQEAVIWRDDFKAGRILSPNGFPYHVADTLHIMLCDARGNIEWEVDGQGQEVIYNDWLTGEPIVLSERWQEVQQ